MGKGERGGEREGEREGEGGAGGMIMVEESSGRKAARGRDMAGARGEGERGRLG